MLDLRIAKVLVKRAENDRPVTAADEGQGRLDHAIGISLLVACRVAPQGCWRVVDIFVGIVEIKKARQGFQEMTLCPDPGWPVSMIHTATQANKKRTQMLV